MEMEEMKEMTKTEFQEKLIELVRDNPAIYDLGHPEHSNKPTKANIWKAIAKSLKKTGSWGFFFKFLVPVRDQNMNIIIIAEEECEAAWTSLKNQHNAFLRKSKNPSGSGRVKIPNFGFAEAMRFLKDRPGVEKWAIFKNKYRLFSD